MSKLMSRDDAAKRIEFLEKELEDLKPIKEKAEQRAEDYRREIGGFENEQWIRRYGLAMFTLGRYQEQQEAMEAEIRALRALHAL